MSRFDDGGWGEEPPPVRIKATPFAWSDPAAFPRRQWLYGRHLIRKFLSCTVAPGGIGKTSLILVEAVAIATGRKLLGKTVHGGPHRVWVINLEDPIEELQRRVLAILMHYKIDPAELGGRLFLDSGRQAKLVVATTTRHGTTIATPMVEALKAEISARRIDFLVVDPLVKAHRVPENDNTAIDLVCSAFAEVADETDCSIELVHHVRKSGGGEITIEDGRGAVSLLGAVRSARVLNPMSKEEADTAGGLVAREFFRDNNGKLNLARPPDKADWFQLRSVSLGNGSDAVFDDSDHVGVVESWEWPDLMAGVQVAHLREVQRRVHGGLYRENVQSPQWIGLLIAEVVGLDIDKPRDKAKVKTMFKTWKANGMFVTVMRQDEKRKDRPFIEVGTWATDGGEAP